MSGPFSHCWQVLVVVPQVTEVDVCLHQLVEQVLVLPSHVTELAVLLQVELGFGPVQVITWALAEQARYQGWKGGGHSISAEQELAQFTIAVQEADAGSANPNRTAADRQSSSRHCFFMTPPWETSRSNDVSIFRNVCAGAEGRQVLPKLFSWRGALRSLIGQTLPRG